MNLELESVDYSYPGANTPILRDVNLAVASGEVLGIAAPSGAGKSTLLKLAALMATPSTGRLSVAGHELVPGAKIPGALRRRIGIVPQSPRAHADPRMKLGALMATPLAFRDGSWRPNPARYAPLLRQWCARLDLDPALLSRRAAEVSDGQLQRVLLARALVLGPDVLICDEPTAQLDGQTTALILQLLTEQAGKGAALLIASHDQVSLGAVCDHVVELEDLQGRGSSELS